MIGHQALEAFTLSLDGAWLDYPFGDGVAVYKVSAQSGGKMFALIQEGQVPPRLSVKGDPQLNELLRDKYETVLPGYHLNKKHWNTIICSGQLSDAELFDLIRHSYLLAREQVSL